MDGVRFRTAGDSALIVEFEKAISPEINSRVMRLAQTLKDRPVRGVTDWIPAFCTLLIAYDPLQLGEEELKKQLTSRLEQENGKECVPVRVIDIPVCYGRYFGPDLHRVAEHAGLTPEDVIREHCRKPYRIYMLGFLPGFAYLGGLAPQLHTPRLAVPRTRIPAGSVGIGGAQTGIYPLDSPGGWQLIGRTPVRVYDPDREEPFLYQAGDLIRFVPIDPDRYYELHRLCETGQWQPAVRTRKEAEQE